jgi:O-acetyl-ADP-ribose deacetylase (regulator of RNase III)
MPDILTKDSVIQLVIGDFTALEVESIVYYASHDLALGSGFGNAIAVRGGVAIQEELKEHDPLETGQAIVTGAGLLKANYIVHAVGPRFREDNLEEKLHLTIKNALNIAKEKGIKQIAFPPMGAGFYGVPLDLCAKVMLEEINIHLSGNSSIEEVVICVIDKREQNAFQTQLESLNQEGGKL